MTIPDDIYSPPPELIGSLAIGFVRMLFAHARFESEVRLLQDAVANEPGHSENAQTQFRYANKRPAEMARLIRKKLGEIPETDDIVLCLRAAIEPCRDRNRLTHGEWSHFDPKTKTITIRSRDPREREPMQKDYREADMLRLTDRFEDITTELYKLRRAVQKYHAQPSLE